MRFLRYYKRIFDWLEEKGIHLGGKRFWINKYRKVMVDKTDKPEVLVEKLLLVYLLTKLKEGIFVDIRGVGDIVIVTDEGEVQSLNLKNTFENPLFKAMVIRMLYEIATQYNLKENWRMFVSERKNDVRKFLAKYGIKVE